MNLFSALGCPLRRQTMSPIAAVAMGVVGLMCGHSIGHTADFQQPEPLQPEVAAASEEPQEVIAGIKVDHGWDLKLYAAEPDVANVVAFDIDHQGRMYVCESFRQNRGVTDNRGHDEQWLLADLASKTVQDRIDYHKRLLGDAAITYAQHDDRIRRLVDTDGDHQADQSTVFASGFNRIEEGTGAGILVRGGNVYYTCIPKLWKLIDQDDDGVSDERVVMSDGYGVRVAFRGHDLHGLMIGPDGRLYFTIGDRGYYVTTATGEVLAEPATGAVFRCELDGSGLEVFCNGLRNPQELAFNDVGDLFTVDNNSDSGDQARIVHLLRGGDSGWRMYYQYLPDRGPFNREKIWEPLHANQPAYLNPPVANFTDGPSGLTYYPGTGFGDTLTDKFLICDFRGGASNSGIRSFQLNPSGAGYVLGDNAQPVWTVLATDVQFGPDGGLYVSDWVNGWDGVGKGRIYRITDPGQVGTDVVREVQTLLGCDWSTRGVGELISDLSHVDRRIRLEAQWELAARGEVEAVTTVMLDLGAPAKARLHALWAADQIARTDLSRRSDTLASTRQLLASEDEILRAAAAKVAGERGDVTAASRLIELAADPSARVRYFATMALADLKQSAAVTTVLSMLAENGNRDAVLRHAGIQFLSKAMTPEAVAALAQHDSVEVRRAAVVALRRMGSGQVAVFLRDINDNVILEAARAIHDVPIAAGLDDLAAMVSADLSDDALLRRVLNANYRIGTADAAAAVASFAARESAPAAMRLEALDMLAAWTQPDPRDRVINDFRPLEPRSADIAPASVSAKIDELMKSTEQIREAAIDVASKLGVTKISPLLATRAAAEERPAASRASALRALSRLNPTQAVAIASGVPTKPASEFTAAALEVLAQFDPAGSVSRFIEATGSSRRQVRQLAWDILAKSSDPSATAAISAAVGQYIEGTLAKDVELNVLEAAAGKIDPTLAAELDAYQQKLSQSDPLARWLPSLNGGNADRGSKLFFERAELSCVRCHKVDRAGGEVGPELTVIGKERDARYLLEAICIPDAAIAKGFETAVIANEDGQILTGIVKTENDEFVELIAADGSQIRVFQDEIVVRKKGNSSMPADLTKYMTPRELRDLVAYLASLKVSSRTAGDTE